MGAAGRGDVELRLVLCFGKYDFRLDCDDMPFLPSTPACLTRDVAVPADSVSDKISLPISALREWSGNVSFSLLCGLIERPIEPTRHCVCEPLTG